MNKELFRSISEIMLKLHPLMAYHFVKPMKELGNPAFPPGYKNVMYCIKSKGREPVSMTDLAAAACIAKPNLTIVVDRLLLEGLVERTVDDHDRRVVKIELTKKGMDFLDEQKKGMMKFFESRFSVLSDEEMMKFKSALEDITETIEKIERRMNERSDTE